MPRTIANDMKTDLGATSAEACFLLYMGFEGAPQYLTNAGINVTTPAGANEWNGHTWVAVGGAIACGGTSERWEPGSSMRLSLSAVDPSILALILQLQYRGRSAKLWWAHWDRGTGTVKDAPLLLFSGLCNDAFDVSHQQNADGSGTMSIETRVSERVSDVGRLRGIRTNVHSHQAAFAAAAGDTFFRNVASLPPGHRIYWGTDSPYEVTRKPSAIPGDPRTPSPTPTPSGPLMPGNWPPGGNSYGGAPGGVTG